MLVFGQPADFLSICFCPWCWTWLEIGGGRSPSKSTSCSAPATKNAQKTMKHGESNQQDMVFHGIQPTFRTKGRSKRKTKPKERNGSWTSSSAQGSQLRQNWIDNQAALCCTLRVRMPKLLLQQASCIAPRKPSHGQNGQSKVLHVGESVSSIKCVCVCGPSE